MLLQIEKFFRICRIKSKIYSNLLSRICEFTVSKRRPTSTIKSSIYVSTSASDLYLPTTGNTELPFEARRNGGPPAEDLVHIAAMFRWTKSVRDRYKRDYPSYASCDREISWPHCVRERVVAHTRMTCVCVCVCKYVAATLAAAGAYARRKEGGIRYWSSLVAYERFPFLFLSLLPEQGNVSEQGRPSDRDGRRQPLATRARRVLREATLLSHCLFGTSVARFGQPDREAWPGNGGGRDAAKIAERGRARTSAERSSFEASGSVHAQRPAGVHSRW